MRQANIFASTCLFVICLYFSISEGANADVKFDKILVEAKRQLPVFKEVEFSNDFKTGIINARDCNCGDNSISCDIKNGIKICTCKPGFAPGEYQICTPMCNDTHMCSNGGSCYKEVCLCLPGTRGPFCNIIDGCSDLKCENDKNANCSYDQRNFKAYCKCQKFFQQFDYDANICKECYCLDCEFEAVCFPTAQKCEIIGGKKTCTCKDPKFKINPKTNTCVACLCGDEKVVHSCEFDKDGNNVCQCALGYQQSGKSHGTCTKCDCGSGICKFNDHEKVCSCYAGYSEWNGTCHPCQCGINGRCEFEESVEKTKCICEPGYTEISGTCQKEKDCYCGENGVCKKSDGEKKCDCLVGFQNVNGLCTDINECDDPKTCPPNMKCINNIGSCECVCKEGFNLTNAQSGRCEDINECLNSSSCPGSETYCLNTIGSFKCVCNPGYACLVDTNSPTLCESKSGWKLGYGVLIGVFFAAYIGLLLIIYKRYRQ